MSCSPKSKNELGILILVHGLVAGLCSAGVELTASKLPESSLTFFGSKGLGGKLGGRFADVVFNMFVCFFQWFLSGFLASWVLFGWFLNVF